MARQCTICSHPERAKIEAAVVANVTYRHIASQFNVGYKSVERHKDNCMQAAIQSVQQKQAEQTAHAVEQAEERKEHFVWNLLDEMKWLHEETRELHKAAKDEGDYGATGKALSEARQQMKLFSELLAGQEPGQAEKLEAEWIAVREAIFVALEPFPEALLAVAEALFALGRGDDRESSQQYLQAATPEDSS